MTGVDALTIGDVRAASRRIAGSVRRVAIAGDGPTHLALEFLADIIHARQNLWEKNRLVVEHGAATALAGLCNPEVASLVEGKTTCVVLCGANINPSDLSAPESGT